MMVTKAQAEANRALIGIFSVYRPHSTGRKQAAGASQRVIAVREKGRSASGAFYFWPTLGPIGARKRTRSAARMTTLATSAGTSAGEARRDAFGSDLGLCWPPLGSHRSNRDCEKEATPERYFFHIRIYNGQSKTAKGAMLVE